MKRFSEGSGADVKQRNLLHEQVFSEMGLDAVSDTSLNESTECNPPHKRVEHGFGSLIALLTMMSTLSSDFEVPYHWPLKKDEKKTYVYTHYCPKKLNRNKRFKESTGPKLIPQVKSVSLRKQKKLRKRALRKSAEKPVEKAPYVRLKKQPKVTIKPEKVYTPTMPRYGVECQSAMNRVAARKQRSRHTKETGIWTVVSKNQYFKSYDERMHKASSDPLVQKLNLNYLVRLITACDSGEYYRSIQKKSIFNLWKESMAPRDWGLKKKSIFAIWKNRVAGDKECSAKPKKRKLNVIISVPKRFKELDLDEFVSQYCGQVGLLDCDSCLPSYATQEASTTSLFERIVDSTPSDYGDANATGVRETLSNLRDYFGAGHTKIGQGTNIMENLVVMILQVRSAITKNTATSGMISDILLAMIAFKKTVDPTPLSYKMMDVMVTKFTEDYDDRVDPPKVESSKDKILDMDGAFSSIMETLGSVIHESGEGFTKLFSDVKDNIPEVAATSAHTQDYDGKTIREVVNEIMAGKGHVTEMPEEWQDYQVGYYTNLCFAGSATRTKLASTIDLLDSDYVLKRSTSPKFCSADDTSNKSHMTRVLHSLYEIVYVIAAFVLTPVSGWDLSSAAHRVSKVQFAKSITKATDLSDIFVRAMKFIRPRMYDLVHSTGVDLHDPFSWAWSDFFHGERSYLDTIDQLNTAEKLVSRVGTKDVGLPKWIEDESAFAIKLDELGDNLDKIYLRAKSEGSKSAIKEVQAYKLKHLALQTSFRHISLSGKLRKAPICFQLCGPSSIAKSSIMTILHNVMCRVYELPIEHCEMFQSAQGDKYYSGFKNSVVTWAHDDVGAVKITHQPQGAVDVIDILRKVNNQPFAVVQADVSDKGTKFFSGKLVLISTNSEDMGIPTVMAAPEATFRRMIRVKISLAAEFQSEDGTLNTELFTHIRMQNGAQTVPNAWNFDVSKYSVANGAYRSVQPTMSTPEFLKWYARELRAHDAKQEHVVSSDGAWKQANFCEGCGQLGRCHCNNSFEDFGEAMFTSLKSSFVDFFKIPTKVSDMADSANRATNCVQESSQAIKELGSRMDAFMSNSLKIGVTILGLLSMMAGYKYFAQCFPAASADPIGIPSFVVSERPDGEAKTWQHMNEQKIPVRLPEVVKTTGAQDFPSIVDKCSNRVGCLRQDGSMARGIRGCCTLLSKNLFVTARHVLQDINSSKTVDIIMSPDSTGMSLSLRGVFIRPYMIEGKDLAFFTVPGGIASRDMGITAASNSLFRHRFLKDPSSLVKWEVLGFSRNQYGTLDYAQGFVAEGLRDTNMNYNGQKINIPMMPAIVTKKVCEGQSGGLVICHDRGARAGALGVISAQGSTPGREIMWITPVSLDEVEQAERHFSEQYQAEAVCLMVDPKICTPVLPINDHSHLAKISRPASGIPECFMANTGTHSKTNNEKPIIPPYLDEASSFYGDKYHFSLPYFGKEPWTANIAAETEARGFVPPKIASLAAGAVSKRFLKNMELADPDHFFLSEMEIVSDYTAINGQPNIAYMSGSKMSSSPGYPLSGKKEKFFEGERPQAKMGLELSQLVEDTIDAYERNEAYGHITKGNLKLEVLSKEKVDNKGTRVFSVVPYACIHIQKRLWMTFKRMLFSNRLAFESAIGYNADSGDVGDLVDYIQQKDNKLERVPRYIAGDFKKFDKRLDPTILCYVFWIIDQICLSKFSGILDKKMPDGRNQQEVYKLWSRGTKTESLFGYGTYDGNLFQRQFGLTSGIFVTSEIGCFYQSISCRIIFAICYYHMVVFGRKYDDDDFWIDQYPEMVKSLKWDDLISDSKFEDLYVEGLEEFDKFVKPVHYGDDHIVSTLVSFPNGKIFEVMYPTLFNMEYTDAQKSKDIQPFNDFESLDFLKRKFRFDDDIGDWVACLLEKSRAKGLSIRVRGAATEMEGHQSSLMSSSNEAWKAGREHYDKHFEMMKDIVSKHFTPGFYYPKTFNEYVEAWRERNASINSQPIIGYNSCYRSGRCNMVKHVEVDAVDYGTPLACAGDSDSVKEIVEEVAEITSTVETPMETRSRPSGLENWFDRPIVVLDSELSKKDLLRVPVWEKFFKNGMHAPKITNFKSLRASLHVRVEVTSSPFVAGRLFVAFLPFERGPRVSSLIPQPNHNISREDEWLATLRKVLQVDHLELDYSTSMNGHLEIPLMLDSDYVPIDKLEDLGTLVILSTYPISCSADQANPTVKCSAWAVDVDLVQKAPSATVANLLAQPATSKLNGLQGDGFRYTFEVETLEGLAKIGNITPIRKGDAKEFWESLESLPCDYPIDKLRKMCQDANFEILMLSRDQGVSALIRGYGGKLEEHIASNFTTAIPTAEEAGLASTVSHMESATVSSGFPMNSSRMAAWAEFHKIFENHIRVGRDTQVARSEETQDLKSILDLQLRDATGNMKTKTYNVAAGFAEKTGTTWTDAASGVTPRSLTGKRKKGAKAVALSSVSVVNTKTDILSLCQTEGLEGVYTFKNYQDFDVSPTGKTPLTSGDGKSLFQFSYLGLFDEISTYWVGEIVFRFRFLKTAYHRGKVVLWFDPSSPYGTSTSPPNMEYNACSHVVIDLSEHHEFDIVIPYPKTKWSNTGSSVGRLCMREYAPLRTPLPQISMEYIVTKRAGSSFTFAKPRPLSNQVWGGAFRASSAPLHGGAQYRLKIEDANMAGAKTKSKESPNSELDSRFAKVKETIPTRPVKATVGEPRAVKARFVLGEPIKQDLVGMQAVLRTIDDFINSPQTEYSGLVDTGDLSRNLSLIHPVLPALNPRALSSVGVQRGRHLSDAFANSSSAKEKFFPTYMALFASCYYGYKGAVSRVIRFNPNTPSQGSHLYVTPYNITNKTSRLNVVADDDEIDGMSSTILSQGSASQAISFQSLDFHDTHFHNTTPNEELGVNGFQLVVNSFATETSFTHMVSKGDGFEYCLSRYAPILVVAEISGASASGRGARA